MPVVDETVVITRPPEPVFDYLCDPDNAARWDTSIVEAQQIGTEPLTEGTQWRGVTKIMGRRFEWVTEITEAERPARMESKSIDGKLTFTVRYELEPHEQGTLLRYRIDAESGLGGVFGRLGDPLVQTAQSRTVRANLRRLAEILS